MKNKVLAMLLALCMVMSLLPVSVFATEGDTSNVAPSVATAAGKQVTGNDPHKRTCTVSSNCTCVVKTEGATAEADTYAWGSLCNACTTAQCGTAETQQGTGNENENQNPQQPVQCAGDEHCVLNNGHSVPHEYACDCDLQNCPYSEHATKHVSKYGDICAGCKAAKAMAEAEANDPATRDCSEGGQQNAQKDNCGATTHYANCPKKCDAVAACTKTKGHTDKHNDTTNCSGDAKCAATTGHDADCPNYTTPADAPDENDNTKTMRTERLSKVHEVEVTCSCQGPHSQNEPYLHPHVVVSGAHTSDPFKIKVTVYEEIKYEVKYKQNSTEEDATATAAERGTAVQGATLAAPQANAIPDEDKLCEYCKAALAAEEAKDEAEAYAECNMTAECQKGVEGAKHNDDCLSLCTMSNSCKNTAGDANAHVVKYAVIKTTTTYKSVVVDGQTSEVTNPGVVDDETPATTTEVFKFLTYAEARAYVDDQDPYGSVNQGKREGYKFEIRTVHCPKSGGVDSTVLTVEADGTTTETKPAEETKVPTKAEEFTDMEDWMAEGVQFALDNKLMEGLGNGKFDGRTKVDAITVATVFARMAGETITGASWKDDAAAWVKENAELFEGIDLEGEELARKDVILVMWRQAGKPDSEQELDFTDVDGLEGDHLTAMKWAVETGIVKGNGDGTATPDGGVSRGELCILLSRSASKSDK